MRRILITCLVLATGGFAAAATADWVYETDIVPAESYGNITAEFIMGWPDPVSYDVNDESAAWGRRTQWWTPFVWRYEETRAFMLFDPPVRSTEWEVDKVELQYVVFVNEVGALGIPAVWRAETYVGNFGTLTQNDWNAGAYASLYGSRYRSHLRRALLHVTYRQSAAGSLKSLPEPSTSWSEMKALFR